MEHTKHLWRALIILVTVLTGAIVTRHFMIPATFGDEGHYRASNLIEFRAKSPVYAGPRACAACHEDEQDAQDDGPHASLSCTACHAPTPVHAKDDKKIAVMPSDGSPRVCGRCHTKLRARPDTIKQIIMRDHLEELGVLDEGESIPDRGCIVCHDAHTTKEKEQ